MSSFTEHTAIQPHKWSWINTKNFRYYLSDEEQGEYIEIEPWFEFNGCSIPFCVFWQRVEPDTITACCIHDWLFKTRQYSFLESNLIFFNALKISWVSWFKRYRYFLWVMIFGYIAYIKD